MTIFVAEPWAQCRDEVLALTPLHYQEASQFRLETTLMQMERAMVSVPLCPDVPRLDLMGAQGNMNCVVGRDRGRLVAYHLAFLGRHIHYDLRVAQGDVHFILAGYRTGRNVLRLWETVHASLAARGVRLVCDRTGVNAKAKPLLEHLGYTRIDETYARWL